MMAKNFIVLLYVALVWAGAIAFVKFEEKTIPPIIIMAGRALLAFLTLFAASLIMKKDLRGNFKHIGHFLVFAILGITLLWVGLALGQEYITVGLASVLVTTLPVITFVILVLILRQQPFRAEGFAGLLIGFLGIIFVIGFERILHGGSTMYGVLLIGGGFVCLAINGILAAKWAKGIDPVITTTYFLGLGTIFLVAFAFIFESPLKTKWSFDNILSELMLGVVCTASGYFGYYYLLRNAGAYFTSFIFYFIPVFGLLVGYMAFNEKVTGIQMVGVVLVLVGVYMINKRGGFKR